MFRDGEWKWNEFSFELPSNVKEKISATPFQLFGNKDTLIWKVTKHGEFSSATTYTLARPEEDQETAFLGKRVQELDTLPRISYFLWLCHLDSVPVREVIAARGVNCDIKCPLCRNSNESILHLLRECPFALDFWRKLGVLATLVSSYRTNLLEWLRANCLCNKQIQSYGYPWRNLFPFAIWALQKHRNEVVFENTTLNHSLHKSCINQATEYFFCVGKSGQFQQHIYLQVRWNKPSEG